MSNTDRSLQLYRRYPSDESVTSANSGPSTTKRVRKSTLKREPSSASTEMTTSAAVRDDNPENDEWALPGLLPKMYPLSRRMLTEPKATEKDRVFSIFIYDGYSMKNGPNEKDEEEKFSITFEEEEGIKTTLNYLIDKTRLSKYVNHPENDSSSSFQASEDGKRQFMYDLTPLEVVQTVYPDLDHKTIMGVPSNITEKASKWFNTRI